MRVFILCVTSVSPSNSDGITFSVLMHFDNNARYNVLISDISLARLTEHKLKMSISTQSEVF